jgi:hypothetical protein
MDETFFTELRKLAVSGAAQDLQYGGVAARIAADRFVGLGKPSAEQTGRFAAFMSDALANADGAVAARIAERLVDHPACPESVLAKLVACGYPASAIVLARAPDLSSTLLLARAERGDASEAAAIAARSDLDARVVAALARRTEPEALRALAANRFARIDQGALVALVQRGRFDGPLGRALLARQDLGMDGLPLFLFADAASRRSMIAAARATTLGTSHASPLQAAHPVAMAAALAGNRSALATSIALHLKASRPLVDSILLDPGLEPLGLVFAALGADAAVARDAICMIHPVLGAAENPNVSLALESSAAAAWLVLSAIFHGRRSLAPARNEGVGFDDVRKTQATFAPSRKVAGYSGLRKSRP